FGVILAVNGVFLYQAIGSYTGIVSDEPYRKGLHYNDRILADAVQHTLGWTHDLKVDKDGNVRLQVVDRSGEALENLDVQVKIGRPSTAQGEITQNLKASGPGVYEANVGALPSGNLVSAIEIKHLQRNGEMVVAYRAKERIWLKP
ncbi:MAG: FixH family protein, partial [Pseudomonadota bacterium]